MKIGLIGLKNSGKTTIFNALTRSNIETSAFGSEKAQPNLAVVDVEDPRVGVLSAMYNPKKTIYATIDLIDFGALSGDARSGLFSGDALNLIRSVDALALVVRNFSDEVIGEMEGEPDPSRDYGTVESELVLSDLIMAENRLERIESDRKRGKKTPGAEAEEKVLRRIAGALNDGTPVRRLDLTPEERKAISGFQFLTRSPMMVILNSDESSYGKDAGFLGSLADGERGVEFAGKFEMELSMMPPDEAEVFMADIGILESARVRLTAIAYDLLSYLSFFTVGEDEVRAWTITRGETAVDAAGTIHSDLARGFIRAECFSYDDLVQAGSEKGIREMGRFRLEGKDYVVRDGDILNIRFSV